MIDTIVLTLNQNIFKITDHDKFEPSTRGLYNNSYGLGSRGYLTCKQNPTSNELKNGIYKPRLTVTRRLNNRTYQIMMKIEFSVPKLIFNNNFDELEEKDFKSVLSTLQQKLKDMDVIVSIQLLANAQVSSIHYSKNIELLNGLIPFTILKEIQKVNITQRLDFNQSDFRNEGHSLKFRANSFEIAFYDKMKDLQKSKISEKRAIEKDNVIQIGMFDKLEVVRKERTLEILRIEVRLNQKQKIRQVLKKIGCETEPTFSNLFKKEIAQKVLLYYLNEIEDSYPKPLYSKLNSAKDFIAQFIIDNPKAKLKDTVEAYGFRQLLEEVGAREARQLLKRFSVSSWYRFIQEINGYNYTNKRVSVFDPMRVSIEEFKPLKTLEFTSKMLNNDKYD